MPQRTFTKNAEPIENPKSTRPTIFIQALNYLTLCKETYLADLFESRFLAFKTFWAFHPLNYFFYRSFMLWSHFYNHP